MFSRSDRVIITSQKWTNVSDKQFGKISNLTITTDKTGDIEFRTPIGIYLSDWDYRHIEIESKWAVGNEIRIGDLGGCPVVTWSWLACIRPGVNIHVGQIVDGLDELCGPQVFYRLCDATDYLNYEKPIPIEFADIAKSAAYSMDPKRAEVILKQTGLDVYQFSTFSGPSSVSSCVKEVR